MTKKKTPSKNTEENSNVSTSLVSKIKTLGRNKTCSYVKPICIFIAGILFCSICQGGCQKIKTYYNRYQQFNKFFNDNDIWNNDDDWNFDRDDNDNLDEKQLKLVAWCQKNIPNKSTSEERTAVSCVFTDVANRLRSGELVGSRDAFSECVAQLQPKISKSIWKSFMTGLTKVIVKEYGTDVEAGDLAAALDCCAHSIVTLVNEACVQGPKVEYVYTQTQLPKDYAEEYVKKLEEEQAAVEEQAVTEGVSEQNEQDNESDTKEHNNNTTAFSDNISVHNSDGSSDGDSGNVSDSSGDGENDSSRQEANKKDCKDGCPTGVCPTRPSNRLAYPVYYKW